MKILTGGIIYGVDLERAPDPRQAIMDRVIGQRLVIPSEANCVTFKHMTREDLIPFIRSAAPGTDIGLEVSSWGGWIKPSQYWPLRTLVGQIAEKENWWLRYRDGTRVEVGTDGVMLGLIDLTIPDCLSWYANKLRDFVSERRPDFLFFDEAHRTLGFLPNADYILGGPRAVRDVAWRSATGRLLRSVGFPAMINGTLDIAACPVFIRGRFVQGAASNVAGAEAMAREFRSYYVPRDWNEREGSDWLVFEQVSNTNPEYQRSTLASLVTRFGGCAQINIGGRFREPIPEIEA